MSGVVSILIAATAPAQQVPAMGPPRKVVVGSLMYSMWGPYPGLATRFDALSSFIDAMAKMARQKYHSGLDVVALPEAAVTGMAEGSAKDVALPLKGAVIDMLGAAARRNPTYVVVPLFLAEDAAKTKLYNACALLDRRGKVVGIYRKVYPVGSDQANQLEGGVLGVNRFGKIQVECLQLRLTVEHLADGGGVQVLRLPLLEVDRHDQRRLLHEMDRREMGIDHGIGRGREQRRGNGNHGSEASIAIDRLLILF